MTARAAVELPDEQRQEQRREGGVEAERGRVAERLAADDADRRCPATQLAQMTSPAPTSRSGSKRPSPRAAIAHDSSTTSCALREAAQEAAAQVRRHADPDRQVARVEEERGDDGRQRLPPAARTEAAANWAEPAKVVALMTIAGRAPMPPEVADRTPNETPNRPTAMANGTAVTAPRRSSKRIGRCSSMSHRC